MDRYTVVGALWRAAVERDDQQQAAWLEAALEREPAQPPEQYDAPSYALWYAEQGWLVFPLTPYAKTPLSGSHGLLDATSDVEQVGAMFSHSPEFNIGLATGHRHDVIDIDGAQGISTIIEKLRENADYLTVPVLGISGTPRGLHLWVAATGRGNSARVMDGVDYRGKGGYVVAPPSRLFAGTTQSFLSDRVENVYEHYRWLMPPEGGE